jgi:hypothetical protein
MVLNGFGDRDDDAFMYVLDKYVFDEKNNAVKAWANRPGCTSWGGTGRTRALRLTARRPSPALVLRANLGQCLVIDFINRLEVGVDEQKRQRGERAESRPRKGSSGRAQAEVRPEGK